MRTVNPSPAFAYAARHFFLTVAVASLTACASATTSTSGPVVTVEATGPVTAAPEDAAAPLDPATPDTTAQPAQTWGARPAYTVAAPLGAPRPLPRSIRPPPEFERALARGTRSPGGGPGPNYWQQAAVYSLEATVDPDSKRLNGRASIRYRNESPDDLPSLYLQLPQNVHASGVVRNEPYEVTGGIELRSVAVDGMPLFPILTEGDPGFRVTGTVMEISPPLALRSGSTLEIGIEWTFRIPRQGAGARMGWDGDDLLFLAYWYPQMAVYDDVVGWHLDPFRGAAEFYAGFGDYDLTVRAPAGWVVRATGELANPEEVLAEPVLARWRAASASDTVVRIVSNDDTGRPTLSGPLAWRFRAELVRDVAFSVTRAASWDGVRAPAGDVDGDGRPDYTRVEALYRTSAPLWSDVAAYARHAIDFHARFTGIAYPWPHMTVVEGGGIITGGMEFPMATLIGDYNARGDSALYWVTAHELAHMWVPMIVGTDERRYAWMDEGMTTFLENQARAEYFPGEGADALEREIYVESARSGGEGEVMRWTDFQYPGAAGVASYAKPATVLVALRALLGEQTFMRAYRTFLREWAYGHPKPWDLFHTFERVAGRDLDWFWHSWMFETWRFDQAIEEVVATAEGTRIAVVDRGWIPMPIRLLVTRVDGTQQRLEVPVDAWLTGTARVELLAPPGAPVIRVELDPNGAFPDIDRANDVWER